jgi:hypothetical protein
MRFVEVLMVVAVSSVTVGGYAYAGATAGASGSNVQTPLPVARPASQAIESAPIVMGRSVAVLRKSKLHHIKAKPAQATTGEKTVAEKK